MSLRNKILITAIGISTMNLCSGYNNGDNQSDTKNETIIFDGTPQKEPEFNSIFYLDNIKQNKKSTSKQIVRCLKTDENSFTHTKILEKIDNNDNAILEFPLSQLFQRYGNRTHPLAVRGIKKNFRALLGKGGIEKLSNNIPQKLSPRSEKITSDTQYETGDTLRFSLIDPHLKNMFPNYLSDQLKEDGFKAFHDKDTPTITKKTNNKKPNQNNENQEKSDFIYDIVVKKLSGGESALAVYRNGELFMTTYVSVGVNNRRTQTGQFKIIGKDPYYYSRKYKSPMPYGLNFDEGGFRFHQGDVTHYPESHGCVRLPGVFESILYSLVKDKKDVDVFIDKNLYIQKKVNI